MKIIIITALVVISMWKVNANTLECAGNACATIYLHTQRLLVVERSVAVFSACCSASLAWLLEYNAIEIVELQIKLIN